MIKKKEREKERKKESIDTKILTVHDVLRVLHIQPAMECGANGLLLWKEAVWLLPRSVVSRIVTEYLIERRHNVTDIKKTSNIFALPMYLPLPAKIVSNKI